MGVCATIPVASSSTPSDLVRRCWPSYAGSRTRRRPRPTCVSCARSRSSPRRPEASRSSRAARTDERRVSIPADLATCDACLRELRTPSDRRHGYAFTNCTHCGPRYTIARDVPYDRPATTMAGFALCPDCRREYEDPRDRRFHAQPIACPACGPRLRLLAADGTRAERRSAGARRGGAARGADRGGQGARRLPPRVRCDVVRGRPAAAAAQAAGREAVRGHGRRPRRGPRAGQRRPGGGAAAGLGRAAHRARPRLEDAALAAEVAPGNPLVGLLLAYTPLHHLLLRETGRPLVMTSGNLSEEPMAAKDDEAVARLAGIADLFLAHDREIENRCDDSVARVIAGAPTILRRSRGYVPRPIPLRRPVARPLLACGAHLKNTFCLAAGDSAWLGPHIGDLDNLEASRAFEEQVERLQRFLGIRPEVIAHDLHPDYVSTRYALERARGAEGGGAAPPRARGERPGRARSRGARARPRLGRHRIRNGRHRPGAASCCGSTAPTSVRLATLRPLRLAGSDEAIRQVWRIALAALDDAFGGAAPLDSLRLFDGVADRDITRGAADRREGPARAAGARRRPLVRRARRARAGAAAVELRGPGRAGVEPRGGEARSKAIRSSSTPAACLEADLRPMVRAAAADLADGVASGIVSARFHETMAEVAVAMVRAAEAGATLAGRAHGGLLPERAPGDRACCGGWAARGRSSATGWCRRATAGSRSARPSWPTRWRARTGA